MTATDINPIQPTTRLCDVFVVTRQGVRVKELVNAQVRSMSWELNEIGKASFVIPVEDPASNAILLGENEIQLWYRGTLIWWGQPLRIRGNARELTVDCDDLLSYFHSAFITHTSLIYDDLDQFTIAWNLISHFQNLLDGQRYITASFTPSGILRLRHYKRDEHENILELLQEFTTLDRGFDFSIEIFPDGVRRWTPYYPRKGVRRANLVLEWGRNISDFTYDEDAVELANHVYCTGGTAGDVKFEENYRDAASATKYGVHHAVISEGSQLDVAWLYDRARREVLARRDPKIVPQITGVSGVPGQFLTTIKVGDSLPVRISRGRININQDYRVQKLEWFPDGDTLGITFVTDEAR